MRSTGRIATACLALATACGAAHAAVITDSTTFAGFSITYDDAVWGAIKFPYEADSFTGTPPVDQFGFGRFFFDPDFAASSDGSQGPPDFTASGEIVITAKPGWGVTSGNFVQSGRWSTTGDAAVSVDGSIVDVTAPGAVFFFTNLQAFTRTLASGADGANGYYYIFGERATLTPLDALTFEYDIHLSASANGGFSHIANDVSDPAFLGGSGPYQESNIVGTFISIAFQRLAFVPEPPGAALLAAALAAIAIARRLRARVGPP